MKNECSLCRGKFGMITHRLGRRKFCRIKCVQAFVKKRDEARIQRWRSILRLA